MKQPVKIPTLPNALWLIGLSVSPAQASEVTEILLNGVDKTGVQLTQAKDPTTVIAGFIQFFLLFVGVLFLVNMLYGGYLWISSRGNTDKIERAKKIITTSVVGVIITLASYLITYAVIQIVQSRIQ